MVLGIGLTPSLDRTQIVILANRTKTYLLCCDSVICILSSGKQLMFSDESLLLIGIELYTYTLGAAFVDPPSSQCWEKFQNNTVCFDRSPLI